MAQKTAGFLKLMVPKVPLILSTTFNHYIYGPPKPSWSFRLSLTVALVRSFIAHLNDVPIRDTQAISKSSYENILVDPLVIASNTVISKVYRDKASEHMDRLLKQREIDSAKLGWDWKNDPKAEEPLEAEWTEAKVKNEKYSEGRVVLYLHGGGYILGSVQTHRWASSAMARLGEAKVLSVDYRLAPDSPFPAALVDALAAYLYLLNPPADSCTAPVDSKNIVIMGDSAGGGLTFATMLAIRDAGLPVPGGIIGISPWLDLLHSMPSVLTNVDSDYLPSAGFTQGGQGSLKRISKLAATIDSKDVFLHHPELPEIQYYASNAVLDCSYVSPLLEKNLEGTCPMLLIVGDGEMLRDEAIVFVKKNEGDLHLLLYDDMPHVFPMFDFLPCANHALVQAGEFIVKATTEDKEEFIGKKSYFRIGVDCQQRPLEEDAIVGWENRLGKLGGGQEVLVQL
ncbi:hypothetical protein BGX26_012141 [Mortierella sp. AD094]|nr:hypothetical protein BGX26_012141 [Mortierella sp. AD094]